MEKMCELKGHSSAVTSVKYNASGTYLISSSLDKLLKIWDENGSCVCTLNGHTRYANCATFSRDSTLVASGKKSGIGFVGMRVIYLKVPQVPTTSL